MKLYGFLFTILFICLLSFEGIVTYTTMQTVELTVTEKERVSEGTSSRYLVFTDAEVFENVDNWWVLKFNSSDVYGRLKVGATCSATVSGWRFPLLSWYRNILSTTC